MDKHLRRSVQSRVLETEHISIIEQLNPLTNLKKHKGVTGAGSREEEGAFAVGAKDEYG